MAACNYMRVEPEVCEKVKPDALSASRTVFSELVPQLVVPLFLKKIGKGCSVIMDSMREWTFQFATLTNYV